MPGSNFRLGSQTVLDRMYTAGRQWANKETKLWFASSARMINIGWHDRGRTPVRGSGATRDLDGPEREPETDVAEYQCRRGWHRSTT